MAAHLTSEQLDELRAIDSPTIANAIEYFMVRPRVAGYCGASVRCLTPDAGFMLGYAGTCKGASTTDGMEVQPGDLLHGDENGITVIPAEIADKIAAKANEHREMEQARLKEILSPDFLEKQFEQATQYR